ncbi:hypothetical protein KAR91_23340, partial [Candidatus Pacearchaeota archaeon]|nr:hypothetical protein [Candidatus Pacearchaeota archaeon]
SSWLMLLGRPVAFDHIIQYSSIFPWPATIHNTVPMSVEAERLNKLPQVMTCSIKKGAHEVQTEDFQAGLFGVCLILLFGYFCRF